MTPSDPPRPGCPSCGRESRPGVARCAWCGADLSSVPVPERELSCPVCEASRLRGGERQGWACHACERCGGLWIEWSTLDQLERAFQSVKPKAAPSAERLPPVKNPVDDTPL